MEEHTPTIVNIEDFSYAKIGTLVNNNFSDKIFDDNVIKNIMQSVPPLDMHPHTEEVIKQIVFNRRLMAERFL